MLDSSSHQTEPIHPGILHKENGKFNDLLKYFTLCEKKILASRISMLSLASLSRLGLDQTSSFTSAEHNANEQKH